MAWWCRSPDVFNGWCRVPPVTQFTASRTLQDLRRTEERFAPGGWQVCCLLAQARLFTRTTNADANAAAAVEALLAGVQFAATSGYKILRTR